MDLGCFVQQVGEQIRRSFADAIVLEKLIKRSGSSQVHETSCLFVLNHPIEPGQTPDTIGKTERVQLAQSHADVTVEPEGDATLPLLPLGAHVLIFVVTSTTRLLVH